MIKKIRKTVELPENLDPPREMGSAYVLMAITVIAYVVVFLCYYAGGCHG